MTRIQKAAGALWTLGLLLQIIPLRSPPDLFSSTTAERIYFLAYAALAYILVFIAAQIFSGAFFRLILGRRAPQARAQAWTTFSLVMLFGSVFIYFRVREFFPDSGWRDPARLAATLGALAACFLASLLL